MRVRVINHNIILITLYYVVYAVANASEDADMNDLG